MAINTIVLPSAPTPAASLATVQAYQAIAPVFYAAQQQILPLIAAYNAAQSVDASGSVTANLATQVTALQAANISGASTAAPVT